jgi:O-antigen/teichoic acid export membrane protein
MRKLVINFAFQALFQATKFLMPIITIPIVSRTLGASGVGEYNYALSFVQFFVLLAGLGMQLYGQREISRSRDDKVKMSQIFAELFSCQVITSSIIIFCYSLIMGIWKEDIVYKINVIYLLAVFFDISWLFTGLERFRAVSIRSMLISILSLALIVGLVNGPEDLPLYVFIQAVTNLLSSLVLWSFLKKEVIFAKPNFIRVINHLRLQMSFFIPQIAIMFYTIVNKLILGYLSSDVDVGYYSNAMMLVNMVLVMVSTIDAVLLPNISNLHAKQDAPEIIKLLSSSLNFQLFLTIPAFFGIIIVSTKIVPWLFGQEFSILTSVIPLVSVIVILSPLSTSISRQYLLPIGDIRAYNYSVILGAICSVFLNIVLVPRIGLFGAVIATIFSELLVTIIRIKGFIRATGFVYRTGEFIKYFASALIMYFITVKMTDSWPSLPTTTIFQICLAIPVYLIVTTMMGCNPLIHHLARVVRRIKI